MRVACFTFLCNMFQFSEAVQLLQENHAKSRAKRAAFTDDEKKLAGVSIITVTF